MNYLDIIPLRIQHYIRLFLLDKQHLLKNNRNIAYCYACGEYFHNKTLCDHKLCKMCCHIKCINKNNYYISNEKSPPYTEDQFIFAIQHVVICV